MPVGADTLLFADTTRLAAWQFAADGRWEEALIIDATRPIDHDTVLEWVGQKPQNIAFEAVFAANGLPATMFGLRIISLAKNEQIARIQTLLLKSNSIRTEADFRQTAAAILPEFPLFTHSMAAVNIGVVGQWFSFGEQAIWAPDCPAPLTAAELKQKAPKFFEPTRNPAAIEFWYTQPADHWYKIYVSDSFADGYVINPDKYAMAVGHLAAFSKLANG